MADAPYPTKTRLRLAEAIAAGWVHHDHHTRPRTFDRGPHGLDDRAVTDQVATLARAVPPLVDIPAPEHPRGRSTVALTDAGKAWLERGRQR